MVSFDRPLADPVRRRSAVQGVVGCRDAIGRLDGVLLDLRKVGFSFITALLAAGAVFGFLGMSTSDKVPPPPIEVRAAVFVILIGLITFFWTLTSRSS